MNKAVVASTEKEENCRSVRTTHIREVHLGAIRQDVPIRDKMPWVDDALHRHHGGNTEIVPNSLFGY